MLYALLQCLFSLSQRQREPLRETASLPWQRQEIHTATSLPCATHGNEHTAAKCTATCSLPCVIYRVKRQRPQVGPPPLDDGGRRQRADRWDLHVQSLS